MTKPNADSIVNTPPEGATPVGNAGGNLYHVTLPGGFQGLVWDPSAEPRLSGTGKTLTLATLGRPTMIAPGGVMASATISIPNPNREADVARIAAEKEAEEAEKAKK